MNKAGNITAAGVSLATAKYNNLVINSIFLFSSAYIVAFNADHNEPVPKANENIFK